VSTEKIEAFYEAFSRRDHETMASLYHPEATFSDPVFRDLDGKEIHAMWHMLCEQGEDLIITWKNVKAEGDTGSADWVATYTFGPTSRKVENRIHASFRFEDGLVIEHRDRFDLWRWLRMATGTIGAFFGWASFAREKVRETAMKSLDSFIAAHPEYQDDPAAS
jgi:ketosteroid isomerase-like protein